MTPTERRAALIQLLASIDQQIAEAERLTSYASLDAGDRGFAAAQLDFRRKAVKRVEVVLGRPRSVSWGEHSWGAAGNLLAYPRQIAHRGLFWPPDLLDSTTLCGTHTRVARIQIVGPALVKHFTHTRIAS